MGDLSEHFSRHEFECKCGCGFDTVDYELIEVHEEMHRHFSKKYGKVKTKITGGNRCYQHNEEVQKYYNPKYISGTSKSTHKDAKASDFKIYYSKNNKWIQINPLEVFEYLESSYPAKYGIGRYSNRTHLDVRITKARWVA